MKKKINLNFMLVIAVSVFLTVFLTTIVSYQLFKKEVFSELSSFVKIMDDMDFVDQMREKDFVSPQDELRITLVSQDGSVLYDSYTDHPVLDNHGDRPEIIQAMQQGEGFCIRKSQTMEQSIFFYAKRTEDGKIVRVAKETGSIWNIYRNIFPVTLLMIVLSFLISVWIARKLMKLIHSQHEETLKNARLRQEFTANVSHELKTPLTSISGYSELIASGMASKKEGRHFAEEIHDNAQRLLTLINDILQLSELDDAPDYKSSFASIDIFEIAGRCIGMMKPVAEKHGIRLSLEGEPLRIQGNKELIEELIYNLCDNAIRYNRKGGHVWISVTDQLIIRDDGIGISKKYQKRVFERFFRVDKSRSKKTGGTGLGLAIVKHIADVHKADIRLESEEGNGTTVYVNFS